MTEEEFNRAKRAKMRSIRQQLTAARAVRDQRVEDYNQSQENFEAAKIALDNAEGPRQTTAAASHLSTAALIAGTNQTLLWSAQKTIENLDAELGTLAALTYETSSSLGNLWLGLGV